MTADSTTNIRIGTCRYYYWIYRLVLLLELLDLFSQEGTTIASGLSKYWTAVFIFNLIYVDMYALCTYKQIMATSDIRHKHLGKALKIISIQRHRFTGQRAVVLINEVIIKVIFCSKWSWNRSHALRSLHDWLAGSQRWAQWVHTLPANGNKHSAGAGDVAGAGPVPGHSRATAGPVPGVRPQSDARRAAAAGVSCGELMSWKRVLIAGHEEF